MVSGPAVRGDPPRPVVVVLRRVPSRVEAGRHTAALCFGRPMPAGSGGLAAYIVGGGTSQPLRFDSPPSLSKV
jgi:hypothetical protein